ncbi:aspartate/glutamate racemase family protein [Blastococcus litoris]|uniref:aspartate/glutamate racemase family protein n=1 Tax=Blastococcus litoris TaxID=2171622 RepID=UPI000E306D44|nr:aspartate/glutamate racemase family protein [Blastococcus litoris]
MAVYRTTTARPVAYGYTIGMLCAEWNVPFVPGDLNNATTFGFPVRYLVVDGAAGSDVLTGDAAAYGELFVAAAKQLEAEGVRAITGNCGYMAAYQDVVAAAVDVPVFMSSLLQAPMLLRMLAPAQRLGVLVANGNGISESVLAGAGITDPARLVVQGLDHQPHFNEVIIQEVGTLDDELMRREVVETAVAVASASPDLGAILLECSDLPPYARAVHEATGLPVFDWAGFIRYVHDATDPRAYRGAY